MAEIPDFISAEECEYIKDLAIRNGLETSRINHKGSNDKNDNSGWKDDHFNRTFWRQKVATCDSDGDELLDAAEAIACLPELRRENVTATMLGFMMEDLELDRDSDARLDAREMWRVANGSEEVVHDIDAWMSRWRRGAGERMVKRWKGRTRVSDQTWLSSFGDDRQPLRDIEDRYSSL